jgi:uncharacterized protein YjbJ (UPF0337 family)
MKSGAKDRLKGAIHQVQGKAKQLAGIVVEDRKLEARGAAQKSAGKTEVRIGHLKQALNR